MEEASQLGCLGSGNKLQRHKKDPGSLGKRKTERMHLGEEREKGMGVPGREREHERMRMLGPPSFSE